MKSKKAVVLLIGLMIVLCATSFAETKKLKEIGRYTLVRIKGEVPTSEVMKILVDKYAGDIKYGFDKSGYGDLFMPFMEQIRNANFAEKTLPLGTHFKWMLFRSTNGQVKVVEDLEWAGDGPLPVFAFMVNKDYKNYEIIMPKPCGNIALTRIEEVIPEATCDIQVAPAKANIGDPITVDISRSANAKSMEIEVLNADGAKVASKSLTPDSPRWQTSFDMPGEYTFKAKAFNMEGKPSVNACETKAYINFPPLCKIWTSCLPCKDYVGRPITIDANSSSDPDGEVARVDFEITDKTGNVIDTYTDAEKPFTWEKVFEKPGLYNVTAVVTDDFGAMSEPCPPLEIEVTQKKCFILVDAGPLFARGSHGIFFIGRAGVMCFLIPDTLSIIAEAGPAIALQGEPWKTFFMGNVLLNFHAGSVYFGGGAGYATKVKEGRDGDLVLIANVGVNVFKNYKSVGSIFFEGHGPVGEGRTFSKHHKYIMGFRYIF